MLAATLNRSTELGDSSNESIKAGTTSSPVPSVAEAEFEPPLPAYLPPVLFPEMKGSFQTEAGIERLAPKPSIVEAASARVAAQGGTLTEAEMRAVLTVAGWPEALHSEALAVSWCESKWSPFALGDSGRSAGLFQVNIATWFRYAGEDAERWADPLVNARVAWATYQYDIGRGYRPWTQWSCRTAVY